MMKIVAKYLIFIRYFSFEFRSSQLPDIKITRKVPLGIRVFDDECDCQVRGLCSTPDGRIIVADCNNKKIKLFDQNGLYLAAHIFPLLHSFQIHICVVDNAEVIAHVLEETGARLYIFDIKDNLFLVKENNQMWHGGFLLSISSCLDKIVKTGTTFGGNAVTLTDRRGEDYWSKSKSTDGQHLFGLPQFSACYLENNKPVIVITDSIKNTIFKLDGETGEILKSISHDAPPFDVAVDADRGILYVCKCHIRQVCVYTTDLAIDNQRTLLTHVDGLCDMPRYTTFNSFNRTLLISSESLAGGNYLDCYQINYE